MEDILNKDLELLVNTLIENGMSDDIVYVHNDEKLIWLGDDIVFNIEIIDDEEILLIAFNMNIHPQIVAIFMEGLIQTNIEYEVYNNFIIDDGEMIFESEMN